VDLREVKIPQINVNDRTARILEWHIKEHARIEEGQPLLTVETSKAVVEIESPEDGFVHILIAAGMESEVGATVALIGPTIEALRKASAELPEPASVRATERARRLALEHGVDLASLEVRGIITERHIRELIPQEPTTRGDLAREDPAAPPASRVVPLNRIQKAVARTVADAARDHVSAYLLAEADWRQSQARLQEIADRKGAFVSPVDLLIFHSARSLREFPRCNAMLTDQGVHEFAAVNVGVTVDVQDDLYVLVVADADRLSLLEIAARRQAHQLQAFRGHVKSEVLEGGTFTVTLLEQPNLIVQIPIVFPNQAAILGAGAVQQRVFIDEGGGATSRPVLGLSLSYDHRFINGAYAARFLQDVASRIEKCQID
jgi:pyruvate/2-oxoglutarate dehydrogenase complex dihydrolipoamide acyltransferase (E2) component